MKLQLTKTKTIEINLPFGNGAKTASATDVTGVELFSGLAEGCPAVRLAKKKNVWKVLSVGCVPAPNGTLPEKWEDMPKQPTWELPGFFQAPHAALAANSSAAVFTQATADAIVRDMASGGATKDEKSAAPEKKRFAIRRAGKTAADESKPATPADGKAIELPASDVPVSLNGMRYTVSPMAEAEFHLESAIPEYQALWLSRLLPEGRRPTASSILLADAALLMSVTAQPTFTEAGGNAIAVFVRENEVDFAGYKAGQSVLWRKCPSVGGFKQMRAAVKSALGLEDELVDSVLDDTLVDPSSALEPFLTPLFNELELSRAYLADKHGLKPEKILLMGLPAGAEYWKTFAREVHKIELVAPGVFEGLEFPAKPKPGELIADPNGKNGIPYLTALGAALAAERANLLKEPEKLSSSPVRLRVMLPIGAILACAAMLVWWGVIFTQQMLVKVQLDAIQQTLEARSAAHATVLKDQEHARELKLQNEQLEYYRAGVRRLGEPLARLAEVMPLRVQLTELSIPAPRPQMLAPPKGKKGPVLFGPTNNTESAVLILAGRTTKETPVMSLMEAIDSPDFEAFVTGEKKVKSFRQDDTAESKDRKLLAFEIEYALQERRFAK